MMEVVRKSGGDWPRLAAAKAAYVVCMRKETEIDDLRFFIHRPRPGNLSIRLQRKGEICQNIDWYSLGADEAFADVVHGVNKGTAGV